MPNHLIEQFLATADHLGPAVERAILTFIAVRQDKQFVLLEGQLLLSVIDQEPKPPFRTADIRAGQYRLSALNKSVAQILTEVEAGLLKLPDGEIVIPKFHGGSYQWDYNEFHPAGGQSRLEVMTVYGREREALVDQRRLDWDLRAAEPPYDNIVELTNAYGLIFATGSVRFEAAAPAVVVVDVEHEVRNTEASVGLVLSKGFDPTRAFLAYRILVKKNVVTRGRLSGDEFEWRDDGKSLRGSAKIAGPEAAIVHCFGGYEGRAQSYGWIVDPNNHQNARRAAYEAFDKDLKKLTEVLFRTPGPGKNAKSDDFETAVSWLLWMRGYSVSLLGTKAIPELKEGPDLLATTPAGHFVVIECTMGMLKEDTKSAKLVGRANQVREHLEKSGNPHLKVLPVMITSLPRSAVEAELEGAAESGVFVITREGIEEALRTSFLFPDADREFNEALALLAEATAASQSKGSAEKR